MPDFSSLKNVRDIDLRGHNIGKAFNIKLLPKSLKGLFLGTTNLSTMPDLEKLADLKKLSLSNNNQIYSSFHQSRLPQSSLESLEMRDNQLSKFPFVNKVLGLKTLDLSNNPKIGQSYKPDRLPNSITVLKLSNTGLQKSFDFSHLGDLEQLDLSNNEALKTLSEKDIALRLPRGKTVFVTMPQGGDLVEIKGRG